MDELAVARVAVAVHGNNGHGPAPHSFSPRFLVATADDYLHEIVDDAVRRLSYTAAFVRLGCEAVNSARSDALSLVLLDQYLPDLAGLDVARALSRDTPELPFVLIGSGLTTSITVEAMKLGALTVLEKPVALNEIMSTFRSAVGESRTTSGPPATAAPVSPRSASERWALHVLKACEADGDLRTLGAWASFVGLSYSSLCESCRLLGIKPSVARDLARMLRAVVQSRLQDCRVEELLDISDRRTLKCLMARAGLAPNACGDGVSIEQFLASQRFLPPAHSGLAVLRARLLR